MDDIAVTQDLAENDCDGSVLLCLRESEVAFTLVEKLVDKEVKGSNLAVPSDFDKLLSPVSSPARGLW